ncbi:MAG TPA: type I-U CRISPR-associated protein Csx17, partial [Dehalococcoidia bacterium]|nr:type I-U CRISPR-associated protein Csx17 [Dehalococcoidia bacterium]
PWDYVLMMEGALFFAGAVARRLSAESRNRAVFPFTVETAAAGYCTAVDTEYTSNGSRAELWVPLWQQPAAYREVSYLFGEGRAQLGRRQASTGTDFARAVVGLGIERGISSFQRFGFLKRNGLAFIATPLGRFRVTPKPEANLLFDLNPWLERLRRASRGQNAPGGLNRALREIDGAILEFCAHGGPRRLQEVLIAVGRAERWLATARQKDSVRPLSGLTPGWLQECDDGSSEFRLAAALASIQGDRDRQVGSIRINLEPVIFDRGRWQWAEDQRSVVWHGGDVLQAMDAVLERRCLEAGMKSLGHLPLEGRIAASLADVLAFLEGRLDYRRLSDLLLPLTAINWRQAIPQFPHPPAPPALSRAYATLKLLFLPWDFRRHVGADELPIRPEPSILHLLRARRTSEASLVAYRRLRASDLTALTPKIEVPLTWNSNWRRHC